MCYVRSWCPASYYLCTNESYSVISLSFIKILCLWILGIWQSGCYCNFWMICKLCNWEGEVQLNRLLYNIIDFDYLYVVGWKNLSLGFNGFYAILISFWETGRSNIVAKFKYQLWKCPSLLIEITWYNMISLTCDLGFDSGMSFVFCFIYFVSNIYLKL